MISLADTLDVLACHLPPALVPPEPYARTRAVAARLPAALTRWMYLECRLGARPGPLDLIVEVDAAGRSVLTGENGPQALEPALRDHPIWRRVAELCRRWADPRSPLHGSLECVWLEFDVQEGAGEADVPVPGVFVGFTPRAARGSAAAEAALEVLLDGPLDRARRDALRRCWAHLPPEAAIHYAGILLPRGAEAVRVCPGDVPRRALPGYLRAIGWPGPYAALATALADMDAVRHGAAARDPALLHLDVEANVLPRLGLEYVFGRDAQLRGRLPDARFLDHLVRRGLCTPEHLTGLASFPGVSLERLPHELWRSVLMRRVNHVKLVLDGDRPPEAKGYLSLHHRYHRPARRQPVPALAG